MASPVRGRPCRTNGVSAELLATGETYRDLGPDYFTQRDPERQKARLVKHLQRLGHTVTLTEGVRSSLSNFPVSDGQPRVRAAAGLPLQTGG